MSLKNIKPKDLPKSLQKNHTYYLVFFDIRHLTCIIKKFQNVKYVDDNPSAFIDSEKRCVLRISPITNYKSFTRIYNNAFKLELPNYEGDVYITDSINEVKTILYAAAKKAEQYTVSLPWNPNHSWNPNYYNVYQFYKDMIAKAKSLYRSKFIYKTSNF